MQIYTEPARDVPLVEHAVVVCGGGPAGVAAALAAARAGARTQLLEAHGSLGGVWTSGSLSWIIDPANKPGIMAEITAELDRRGARQLRGPHTENYAYDVEEMKLLLEELCLEAGVEIQLHTRVVAAARDSENRLSVVLTESKSGREAWAARCFVDATGDGDLAAQAGCGFDMGHPDTGAVQPMTLIALLGGIKREEVEEFVGGNLKEPKARLFEEMGRAGVEPSYGMPTIFHVREGLFAFSANHEYNVDATDAAQITAATIRARRELHTLVNGLRSLGHPWRNLRLITTAEQIGVREARRIHGRYTVTVEDAIDGARHEDAVCRVAFGIDVHSTDPRGGKSYSPANRTRTQPYDIPLRALIARDVDGLLLAGRCISGDFLAHSSYRVTGNAVAMGKAAGIAAALAAQHERLPHEVPWQAVVERLSTPVFA